MIIFISIKIFVHVFHYSLFFYILLFQKQLPEVFYKKLVLKKFSKFTGKHLHGSFFFNKLADLRPAALLKKRLKHMCFPVNFVKFLRTLFTQNTHDDWFCVFLPLELYFRTATPLYPEFAQNRYNFCLKEKIKKYGVRKPHVDFFIAKVVYLS